MRNRFNAIAGSLAPRLATTHRYRLLLGLCVFLFLLVPRTVLAQQELPNSTIAGVIFPQPARVWFPDPQRSQAAALNTLADLVDRSCTTSEFHIWYVDTVPIADDLRVRIEAAFQVAGWTLDPVAGATTGLARDYLARRGDAELLMSWVPLEGELGLLLCTAGPPPPPLDEGAGGALQVAEIRAADGTPLPRPRPDPNASPVEAATVPLPGLVAAEPNAPAADGAAVAELINAQLAPPGNDTPPATTPAAAANVAQAAEEADVAETGSSWTFGLLLLAILFAGGAFFMFRLGLASGSGRGVAKWPAAIATIVYSQVASETKQGRDGKETMRYVPVIAYEYTVEETLYRAARLSFGDAARPNLNEAKNTTDRYPVGAGIEIRYNPARPADAVIEPGAERMDMALFAGVALAVLALASLISAVV